MSVGPDWFSRGSMPEVIFTPSNKAAPGEHDAGDAIVEIHPGGAESITNHVVLDGRGLNRLALVVGDVNILRLRAATAQACHQAQEGQGE